MQSHLHRFVVELLYERLRDLHFCTYEKVECTLLREANRENQSWKERMWEGISSEERNVDFDKGSTITHCLMSIKCIPDTA